MFPAGPMQEADKQGYDSHTLVCALFDESKVKA